jgi:hypothetical protein
MSTLKPPKTTLERERKALCELTVERAVALMVESGASAEMIVDRMLTWSIAQACLAIGSQEAAAMLRTAAEKTEAGLFHKVTGEVDARH